MVKIYIIAVFIPFLRGKIIYFKLQIYMYINNNICLKFKFNKSNIKKKIGNCLVFYLKMQSEVI